MRKCARQPSSVTSRGCLPAANARLGGARTTRKCTSWPRLPLRVRKPLTDVREKLCGSGDETSQRARACVQDVRKESVESSRSKSVLIDRIRVVDLPQFSAKRQVTVGNESHGPNRMRLAGRSAKLVSGDDGGDGGGIGNPNNFLGGRRMSCVRPVNSWSISNTTVVS